MSDQIVEEFLEHVGVKGMKWGVRKAPSTKGYSKDAKVAVGVRKKAKKSPAKVKALSNQEIEVFLKRVNLEASYKRATPGPGAKTMNVINVILGRGKTVNDAIAFSNSPAGQTIQTKLSKKSSRKSE